MDMTSAIVIGSGYAGVMVANRAAALGLDVTIVTDSDAFVDRIRLHEVIAGTRPPEAARLPVTTSARTVGGSVSHVEEGGVTLEDGRRLTADHIVIATGSGAGIGGWAWAEMHRAAVARLVPGRSVAVLGAGLTGLETASELAEARRDLRVTLVDPEPIGRNWSARAVEHTLSTLTSLGVTITTTPVDADHTIECTGFTRSPLAADSGLPVTEAGAVIVDPTLRVQGYQRLWACGDAAEVEGMAHLRMACATAEPMAAAVADNLARVANGEALEPFSLGYLGQWVSLGRSDGVIQWVRSDDSPKNQIWTGRPAAIVKELLCRFAAIVPARWYRIYTYASGPAAKGVVSADA